MATITNAILSLAHDHRKKLVTAVVKCNVNFTALELCQMKTCSGRYFKLKCQLWASDPFYLGGDSVLYSYTDIFYFPDANPNATESRKFEVILGEGVLDEDWLFQDEVYGLIKLFNLTSLVEIKKKTNIVSHSF